jgi:hypothetical protein
MINNKAVIVVITFLVCTTITICFCYYQYQISCRLAMEKGYTQLGLEGLKK